MARVRTKLNHQTPIHKCNNVRDHTNISDHFRKKVIPWYSNGPASLFCLIWLWSFGTTRAMSGCISSQASEGVCHCATICTRFSGKLNPLTPQFLIKITLGVISRKSWGWRSEATREGQVSRGTVCIDDGGGGGGGGFDPKPVISAARCCYCHAWPACGCFVLFSGWQQEISHGTSLSVFSLHDVSHENMI